MTQTGLRERSKERRRIAIVRAALELFAARGFDATTVADVAEAAEVSPRTVSLYFPTKLDLALSRVSEAAEEFADALRHRAPGRRTSEVVAAWLRQRNAQGDPDGLRALSRRMFETNPDLRALRTARISNAISESARTIAEDMDVPPDDIRARIAAAATAAVMLEFTDAPELLRDEDAIMASIDFLEAGISRLSR
jgi:AcrR family transcriptional regulator